MTGFMKTSKKKLQFWKMYFTKRPLSHEDIFLGFGLGFTAVFGILAFITSAIHPLGYVFGGLALLSFILGIFLEVSAGITRFFYRKGILSGMVSAAKGIGAAIIGIIGIILGFVYFGLGGMIVSAVVLFPIGMSIPVLKPLTIVLYVVGSFRWAMNSMEYWEDTSTCDTLPHARFAEQLFCIGEKWYSFVRSKMSQIPI